MSSMEGQLISRGPGEHLCQDLPGPAVVFARFRIGDDLDDRKDAAFLNWAAEPTAYQTNLSPGSIRGRRENIAASP